VHSGHAEFDWDDSDRSSVYSTPSPQIRQFQTLASSSVAMPAAAAVVRGAGSGLYRPALALTAYHPSLRKKKWYERQSSVSVMAARHQNTLDKSWSLQTSSDRPLSLLAPPYSTHSSVIANKVADTLLQQVSICWLLLKVKVKVVNLYSASSRTWLLTMSSRSVATGGYLPHHQEATSPQVTPTN